MAIGFSARRVFWASQETITDWNATAINSAGYFDLATDGVLVCGKALRGQSLIWTTTDAWTMTFIGSPYSYSFARVGRNCGIISQHAAVVLDTGAYWMGLNRFFVFDGAVKQIPCEVNDYVFGNFNSTYASKVWGFANPQFSEITWFYPSAGIAVNDSYVTYNYLEDHWVFGSLARETGIPYQAGATTPVPVMIGFDGRIYDHETGTSHSGDAPYLESGPVQLGEGDQVMRIQQIVPDDKTQGDVSATLYTALFPDSTETANGPYTLTSPTSVRLTARQVRLKLTESVAGAWRVGVVRLGALAGGRR